MNPVKFGIVGIGGFGQTHVRSVEALERKGRARLDAAVVIDPENHPEKLAEFKTRNIRVYDTYDDLLSAGGIDYVTLPIGIHYHVPYSVSALEAGFNVICEKTTISHGTGRQPSNQHKKQNGQNRAHRISIDLRAKHPDHQNPLIGRSAGQVVRDSHQRRMAAQQPVLQPQYLGRAAHTRRRHLCSRQPDQQRHGPRPQQCDVPVRRNPSRIGHARNRSSRTLPRPRYPDTRHSRTPHGRKWR